jgi:AcrR family transcriptional regulator
MPAIACFWSRGLEATSVRDLAEHMGILGSSLYNAFGDKRTLFALALERCATRVMRDLDRSRRAQVDCQLRIPFQLDRSALSAGSIFGHLGCESDEPPRDERVGDDG